VDVLIILMTIKALDIQPVLTLSLVVQSALAEHREKEAKEKEARDNEAKQFAEELDSAKQQVGWRVSGRVEGVGTQVCDKPIESS
jgi:hypothetical protein